MSISESNSVLFAMRIYQDWIICKDVNLTEWENDHLSLEWEYVWLFFLYFCLEIFEKWVIQ